MSDISGSAPRRSASPACRPALPRRSQPVPVLRKSFCLRCIKRLGRMKEWRSNCECPPNGKCDYCVQQHKACDKIPAEFVNRANEIFDSQDMVKDLRTQRHDDMAAYKRSREDLAALVQLWTRDVERFMRARARRGGLARAPRTTLDVIQSAMPILNDIRDSLQQLVDVQRFVAGLDPLIRDDSDDE